MMLTSLDEYFSADVLMFLRRGSLHSALGHCDFWTQQFHKRRVWDVVGCL